MGNSKPYQVNNQYAASWENVFILDHDLGNTAEQWGMHGSMGLSDSRTVLLELQTI